MSGWGKDQGPRKKKEEKEKDVGIANAWERFCITTCTIHTWKSKPDYKFSNQILFSSDRIIFHLARYLWNKALSPLPARTVMKRRWFTNDFRFFKTPSPAELNVTSRALYCHTIHLIYFSLFIWFNFEAFPDIGGYFMSYSLFEPFLFFLFFFVFELTTYFNKILENFLCNNDRKLLDEMWAKLGESIIKKLIKVISWLHMSMV